MSVASYRDPDLIPTLQDAVRRARYPADLRFGICWQHGEDEPRPPDLGPARMQLIDVDWRESQGACWARAELMKLWEGEAYFLQIDSHMRFVQDWDAKLLDQAERSGSSRPLLTTYGATFDPAAALPETDDPTGLVANRFMASSIPLVHFRPRPDWRGASGPMRARFLSAHLLFTLGRFVTDIPYDPELYFMGEEITLAVRAFTHGYDLLHPSIPIAWHRSDRSGRALHWDDHRHGRGLPVTGSDRDAASLAKVAAFLERPSPGVFGCGTSRSFAEYESYAGLSFRRRILSAAARRGDEPPPPPPPGEGVGMPRDWSVRIALDRTTLPPAALDRPAFWYVGFHDAAGTEVARADASRQELYGALSGGSEQIVIERRFQSARPPATWAVQPTDCKRVWLGRLTGVLAQAGTDPAATMEGRA